MINLGFISPLAFGETGSQVFVAVIAVLIAVVTTRNHYPLNGILRLQGADAYFSTYLRLEKGSSITAYVKAGDHIYFASTRVKLSHGGYGTHVE